MSQAERATVVAQMEDNLADFLLHLGAGPSGEVYDGQDVKWVYTRTAALNRVLCAKLQGQGPAVEKQIQSIVSRFEKQPLTWIVGPSSEPKDLGARLLAQGFIYHMRWAGMALDLRKPISQELFAPGVTVRKIHSPEDLRLWAQLSGTGFQLLPEVCRDLPTVLGALNVPSIQCYLGYYQGQPVATACTNTDAVCGIYFVSTLPQMRKRGLARALTLQLLRDAKAQGLAWAMLQASPSGYPIYKRLGFEDYCTMDLYGLIG